jgi:hypothetical protein
LTENTLLAVFPMASQARLTAAPGALLTVAGIGFCLLLAGGCAMQQAPVTVAPPPPVAPPSAPTELSVEAMAALQAAEQSVIEARVRRALWTTAVDELAKARAAAKIFDSANTLVHAREAVTLCELSIKQTAAPPVTW